MVEERLLYSAAMGIAIIVWFLLSLLIAKFVSNKFTSKGWTRKLVIIFNRINISLNVSYGLVFYSVSERRNVSMEYISKKAKKYKSYIFLLTFALTFLLGFILSYF